MIEKNKVVIHTLRHTFASHLAINETPIFTIQKLMNHKDIKMTLRYAKLSPDSGREAVLKLGL
jgi:integrase